MRYTLSSCTPLPCTLLPCTALPTAGLALASALPRRRSLRSRPRQVTAVRNLVALRASRSRAATPHLHPRTPELRTSLARITLLLTRLNPPCAPLLAPGRSPPLGSCSCAHTPTPPVSAPRLLQRLFLPSSRAHPAPVPAHACSRVARSLRAANARLHTPPASARHRAHARATRSASPTFRSCTAREPLQSCACPLTRAAWSPRRSVPPAHVPVAAAVHLCPWPSRCRQPPAPAPCRRPAHARARPVAAAGRSRPLAPRSTPLAWAARLQLGPRPPAVHPWLCWIPSARA
jgi:hypothetical protein